MKKREKKYNTILFLTLFKNCTRADWTSTTMRMRTTMTTTRRTDTLRVSDRTCVAVADRCEWKSFWCHLTSLAGRIRVCRTKRRRSAVEQQVSYLETGGRWEGKRPVATLSTARGTAWEQSGVGSLVVTLPSPLASMLPCPVLSRVMVSCGSRVPYTF